LDKYDDGERVNFSTSLNALYFDGVRKAAMIILGELM
jgi:hypothetical protein